MKAGWKILAGGVGAAALFSAAPAAAQYYPSPYGYGNGGNIVGQVINQVLGGGLGGYGGYGGYGGGYGGYGYGVNSQAVVNQCASAVQQRLGGGYGGYGGYSGYGYGGGARVLGISRVEQRSRGGLTVRGVASSGYNAGYAYGGQQQVDLTWTCRTDYRGMITDIDVDRAQSAYGYNNSAPYQPYNPYAQYGYQRY